MNLNGDLPALMVDVELMLIGDWRYPPQLLNSRGHAAGSAGLQQSRPRKKNEINAESNR